MIWFISVKYTDRLKCTDSTFTRTTSWTHCHTTQLFFVFTHNYQVLLLTQYHGIGLYGIDLYGITLLRQQEMNCNFYILASMPGENNFRSNPENNIWSVLFMVICDFLGISELISLVIGSFLCIYFMSQHYLVVIHICVPLTFTMFCSAYLFFWFPLSNWHNNNFSVRFYVDICCSLYSEMKYGTHNWIITFEHDDVYNISLQLQ